MCAISIIQHAVASIIYWCVIVSKCFFDHRLDSEMPEGVEIINSTLLFLRPLHRNDSGVYRCEVANDINLRSRDVRILIQGEWIIHTRTQLTSLLLSPMTTYERVSHTVPFTLKCDTVSLSPIWYRLTVRQASVLTVILLSSGLDCMII